MLDQVCGPVTGVNLEHMTPLMLPWTQDPWGEIRPPVSVEAMRMSAELAAATYHMEIERWLQAGWRDVTIQVDPAKADLVETRVIGGVKYLLINAEENVEVNGVNIHIGE